MFKVNWRCCPGGLLPAVLQFGVPALFLTLTCLITFYCANRLSSSESPGSGPSERWFGAAYRTAAGHESASHAPLWLGALGTGFAILFGKQIYGGLGQNLFNPAMLARVVLLIAFPVEMTHWISPSDLFTGHWYGLNIDGISGATTLGLHKEGKEQFDLMAHLTGLSSGSLGETASILLVLGGLWLMQQQVFTWHVPVAPPGVLPAAR